MNRTLIFTTLLCAGTLHASAQEKTDLAPAAIAPRLVLGSQTGASLLFDKYSNRSYAVNPTAGISQSIFARYYMGKHLALEGGINLTVYNKETYTDYYYLENSFQARSYDARMISYEIPLQLQYHLLNKESKLRPYFGVGVTVARDQYRIKHYDGATTSYTTNNSSVFFTQGLTYQINKNWQLNQSLVVKSYGQNGISTGLMFGVGYSFNK